MFGLDLIWTLIFICGIVLLCLFIWVFSRGVEWMEAIDEFDERNKDVLDKSTPPTLY